MAVRGPTGPGARVQAPMAQGTVGGLAKALGQAGILKPGQNPKAMAQHIVDNLVARGYGGKVGKQLVDQLKNALLSAQRSHGLNTSGKLDKATVALLRSMGIVSTQAKSPAGVLTAKDGFVRPQSAKQKAPQTQLAKAPAKKENSLEKLATVLEQRLGDFGKTLGGMLRGLSDGAGALAQRMGEALGRLTDGGSGAAKAAEGQDAGQNAANQPAALPAATTTASNSAANVATANAVLAKAEVNNARSHSLGEESPKGKGAKVGDALQDQGRGKNQGQGSGLVGEGEGQEGLEKGEGDTGLGDRDDEELAENDAGNASSGDDDFADKKRGHSSLDDGSEDGAGYYKVPKFTAQLDQALQLIVKEEDRANKATTYSWDFVLYKPGVYGAKEQAEELLHVQVREALPFDDVWEQARQEIARRIRRYDSKAKPPTNAEIQVALRRARVKDD